MYIHIISYILYLKAFFRRLTYFKSYEIKFSSVCSVRQCKMVFYDEIIDTDGAFDAFSLSSNGKKTLIHGYILGKVYSKISLIMTCTLRYSNVDQNPIKYHITLSQTSPCFYVSAEQVF